MLWLYLCVSLQPALKRFLLSRVPLLLSIRLKRFDFVGGGGGYWGGEDGGEGGREGGRVEGRVML